MGVQEQREREQIRKVQRHLYKAAKALSSLSDQAAAQALHERHDLLALIRAVLEDPRQSELAPYAFLQQNKQRSQAIAILFEDISKTYPIKARLNDGREVLISPRAKQQDEDQVMFNQGKEPFSGVICALGLTDPPEAVRFATSLFSISPNGKIRDDDLAFLTVEEADRLRQEQGPRQPRDVYEGAIETLRDMLRDEDNAEANYQKHLSRHPWMLGMHYVGVDSHKHLDDENIPDFTAVRATDHCRDLIEIKPPFTRFFNEAGKPLAAFHEAWNQAERYLDFARQNADYLRNQKDLIFDNPKCYLLLGDRFSDEVRRQIRVKTNNNPAITVLNYHSLLSFAEHTLKALLSLESAKPTTENLGTEPEDEIDHMGFTK